MKKARNQPNPSVMSLSKFLAQSGVCARRKAVTFIQEGAVTVNHVIILEPGYKLQSTDRVEIHGSPIKPPRKVYIVLNKPRDYITTMSDDIGRRTVMHLIDDTVGARVYPVGRLDRNTTGVLLLTNDGELAEKLSHPRNEIRKVYHVVLNRCIDFKDLDLIKAGIRLEDGMVHIDDINCLRKKNELIIEIHSGKNRVIRRLFEHLKYEVLKLDRITYAGISKQGVALGSWRYLGPDEVMLLKNGDAFKEFEL